MFTPLFSVLPNDKYTRICLSRSHVSSVLPQQPSIPGNMEMHHKCCNMHHPQLDIRLEGGNWVIGYMSQGFVCSGFVQYPKISRNTGLLFHLRSISTSSKLLSYALCNMHCVECFRSCHSMLA